MTGDGQSFSERSGDRILKAFARIDEMRTGVATRKARDMGTRGQLGLRSVLAALVLVIAASLAVIVVDKFDDSAGNVSNTNLSTAQQDVLQGFSDMTSLIGPLLLVSIAIVIIGLIRRVQSQ